MLICLYIITGINTTINIKIYNTSVPTYTNNFPSILFVNNSIGLSESFPDIIQTLIIKCVSKGENK